MQNKPSKLEAEEKLGYYDFMAQMGVPYFHWGGIAATDRLLCLCKVNNKKKVLVVGCGTGYSASHIAGKYGCRVFGIDISEMMIAKAKERAYRLGLADDVKFQVADAYDLPFEEESFDIVISEFVTVFLRGEDAFREYHRVLRSGGYLGINELYRSENIPSQAKEIIRDTEKKFGEAIGLSFYLPTDREWEELFRRSHLKVIQKEEVESTYRTFEYVEALGGWTRTLELSAKSIYHLLFNRRMRRPLMQAGKMKKVLMRNKNTRQYLGAMLFVGRKGS